MPIPDRLVGRFADLQRYVGWSEADVGRIRAAAPLVSPHFVELVNDFYREIEKHDATRTVIGGDAVLIARLRKSLEAWLAELFAGIYDVEYLQRRWRVGLRHVEIGLDQVYTNAALSRLRVSIVRILTREWKTSNDELAETLASVMRLLDLDLAIIEDAYQAEFVERQQRNDRLAAIGQMGGGVAHELRNPLNVIKTSVYFLLNAKNTSPEKLREHLERIERQVGLADKVITALNEFARLPAPKVMPIDAARLLKDVLETLTLPDAVNVTQNCRPGIAPLAGDAAQLLVVFSNLIRNAIEAMADAGTLQLSTGEVDGQIFIEVADTGHGIAPENLGKVFEPLFSTKTRGIGLGLAIVRTIVKNHRGTIHVTSQKGQGTQFMVKLPAHSSAAT